MSESVHRKNLEEKRKKVEDLRKRRAERNFGAPNDPLAEPESPGGPGGSDPDNVMDLVKSLIGTPVPGRDADTDIGGLPPAPSSSGASGLGQNDYRGFIKSSVSLADRISKLKVICPITELHIPPVSSEVYDKSIQTDESSSTQAEEETKITSSNPVKVGKHRRIISFSAEGGLSPVPEDIDTALPLGVRDFRAHSTKRTTALNASGKLNSPLKSPLLSPTSKGGEGFVDDEKPTLAKLSAEEARQIMENDAFTGFFNSAAKVVERALGASSLYDIFVDYTRDEGVTRETTAQSLNPTLTFYDEKFCHDRSVTDLHWSPHHSELMLCAYNARGVGGVGGMGFGLPKETDEAKSAGLSLGSDPDGLVLVWSLSLQQRPEYYFTAQSPVLTARFHDQDPHLLIGGTYSGQIVVWDLRAKSLPVQRSQLSAKCHNHPVYSLGFDTGNAQRLVTASTDGRVCFWNLNQLIEPTDSFTMKSSKAPGSQEDKEHEDGGKNSPPIAVSSFAITRVGSDNSNDIVVGSESGHLYRTQMHLRDTTNVVHEFKGHFGLVTALDFNTLTSKKNRLLLSTGVDWCTKLWNPYASNKALLTFHYETHDYVCDVKWSPKHPALFVTAATSGELSLWNLNHSTEEPLFPPVKVIERCALNKLAWSHDGRRIAVGDANGTAHVYSLADEVANPRSDEESRLEQTLRSKDSNQSNH